MSEEDESFDPYRFGHPDVPPPPEFAPPGYKPPPVDLAKPAPYPGPPSSGPQAPPYGYPPAQQQPPYPPYSPVPYPPYHPAQGQTQGGTSGKAIAAMVLGIASVVFFWTTIVDIVVIILAVIFGVLGLTETRNQRRGGRGQAIAGLICAGVAAVLVVVTLVLVVRAADHCGGLSNSNAPGFNQCVRDHIFSQRK